jgi:hypothetical protein
MAGVVPATHDRKSPVSGRRAAAALLYPRAVFMGGRHKASHYEITYFQ